MKRWITTKKFLKFSNSFHKIIQCQYQNLQNTERIILETNSSHWYRFKITNKILTNRIQQRVKWKIYYIKTKLIPGMQW